MFILYKKTDFNTIGIGDRHKHLLVLLTIGIGDRHKQLLRRGRSLSTRAKRETVLLISFSAPSKQARSQGVRRTPQIWHKVHFWLQSGRKWGFCRRVEGVRFKESIFWVQRVHFWGVPHPPDSILATGLPAKQAHLHK